MTLGRRAFLLILPVVFAGYAIAASVVYMTQRDSLMRLEQARLGQRFDHLNVLLENDKIINRGFIHAIKGGGSLRSFLQESDEAYRSHALGVRLKQTIDSLAPDKRTFLSFSVLTTDLRVVHYFENSLDPFAEFDPAQLAYARSLIARSESSASALLQLEGPQALIVNAEFIDPLTMNRPFAGRAADTVLVMAAIRPDRFIEMKRSLEAEYRAKVEFGATAFAPSEPFSVTTSFGPDVHARLTPDPAYFADRLLRLKAWLTLGAILMSLMSIALLIGLVRSFITKPIAKLDRQLTEVLAGRRASIAVADDAGEIGSLSANMKSLHDDFVRSLRDIQTASWTDTLTGVSNRAHFNVLAGGALAAADRDGAQCGLLFIDVDHFKFVNDRFGHETGDALLKELAARFDEVVAGARARHVTAEIALARLSGDEFAVLVQSPEAAAVSEEIAAGVLGLFDGRFDARFPVGVSIGVAAYPHTAGSLGELLSNADLAMYEAKTGGRNRSARFSVEIRDRHARDRAIQEELRGLDPDEEFRLVYMPIVDASDRVVSCEALLRWTSPRLGEVSPGEFVPIAERNGLFSMIDRWVIDKALGDHAQLAEWFGEAVIVAINVSSAELHATSLRDHLAARLAARQVAPERVEIELTETFAVGLHAEISRNVAAFRDVGVRIAIDDFGAGYTSIRQVTEYSADTIKLDLSFVARLVDQPETLKALVALCHAQGMSIVAEGVDTARKADVLRAAGCDALQGYEICRPLALTDLGLWALAQVAASRPGAAVRDRKRVV